MDFKSFEQVDRLTFPEYELLMEAVRLKQIDADYRNHLQAYLNYVVKAKKEIGKGKYKPVYRKFIQFYDYAAKLKEATQKKKESSRFSGIEKFLRNK